MHKTFQEQAGPVGFPVQACIGAGVGILLVDRLVMGPGNIVGFERKLDHGIQAPVQYISNSTGTQVTPIFQSGALTISPAAQVQVVLAGRQRIIQADKLIEFRIQPADVNIDASAVIAVQ